MKEKFLMAVRSSIARIRKGFDLRDIFVLGGLVMMGYGLFLFRPWVAFTACGILLMAGGINMERKRGNS